MALNNRMKEVQKAALKDEKHTIQLLQRIYEQAAKDTEVKIAALNARTDLQNIQSIVYQKQYQEALKKQLDGIINDLHTQSFTTVSDYLGKSYEHGFYGTLYDLQGQGVPFLFPIRQDEVVKALNNDYSNIAKTQRGKDIYKRMGENTDYLKKAVRAEVSRGIANGSSWLDMATHVAKGMNSPFNRAMKRAFLITRTEGHRIQNQATVDVQKRAKGLGADIVKQWDATLDANTRPWHADADGQIREIDEEFDVGGEKMKAPGIGGSARNVCNCRCVLLQRAKWALNKNETKYLGDVSSMTDKQKKDIAEKLGVSVDDLPNISKSIVPIHAKDYDDFIEKAKLAEYKEWTLDDMKKARHKVTSEERSIIYGHSHFTGYINSSNARKINGALRDGKELSPEYQKISDTLQSVIDKNAIPDDIKVVRYVSGDAFEPMTGVKFPVATLKTKPEDFWKTLEGVPNKIEKNHKCVEKGFLSTSAVEDKNVMQRKPVQLNICVPKGTHGYISSNYKESEIIFGKGSTLTVIGSRIDGIGKSGWKVVLDCILR